jgi:hypothetical protein
VAGCEFGHRGCGTDQMPDAQKRTNQTMVAFGSVCMIALFVLLSRATVSLSLPLALLLGQLTPRSLRTHPFAPYGRARPGKRRSAQRLALDT